MSHREVKGSDEVINSAIESMKRHGFINYYGPQRFGSTSILTHSIGRELLKSNWQQVKKSLNNLVCLGTISIIPCM